MAIQVSVKKWGNSVGILLPKEIVEKEKLKVDEKIFIEVVKKANLTHIFGSLKGKTSGQDFKNMVRRGWN